MKGRYGNLTSTLYLTRFNTPPPFPPLSKHLGHAPEEEKEIAQLSKKESTRSVQRLSRQNRMVIPYRFITLIKKKE